MKTNNFDYARAITKPDGIKIINKQSLAKKLGVSESTIYRMNKQKELPKPLLSPKGRIRGWLRSSIEAWITNSQRN
ncbi:helix-turn-helix transcriptional regulator [Vibrio tapetis]|uniref:Putative transcriptional regulator n=1 Tax=Vibrio tapetis subsp. tapetis TaxID=1671868 RepID=A0A2N8ZES1_9VIBR|nr:AlpA family phage regulatory protein [Vibrio tapetis]SON50411.1 putative transcriptional regulator [Vibrio tapetis subsp. tapetis]